MNVGIFPTSLKDTRKHSPLSVPQPNASTYDQLLLTEIKTESQIFIICLCDVDNLLSNKCLDLGKEESSDSPQILTTLKTFPPNDFIACPWPITVKSLIKKSKTTLWALKKVLICA